jgi:hypothetical protein
LNICRIHTHRICGSDQGRLFVSIGELDKLTNQLVGYIIQYESAEPVRLFFLPYQELSQLASSNDTWGAVKAIRRLATDMMLFRAKAFPADPVGQLELRIVSDPLGTAALPAAPAVPAADQLAAQSVELTNPELLIPSATLPPGMSYQPFDFEDNVTWEQLFGNGDPSAHAGHRSAEQVRSRTQLFL